MDRKAVSNWVEPYWKTLKPLRIDRSKKDYEVKKEGKLYLIDDERVRTSGVLFRGKEKELWGVKR